MSSIVALLNRDGAPASASSLRAMLAVRPERGPDGVDLWCKGPVALGRGHFWITAQEWGERQPLVDNGLALVADARLDNRAELAQLLAIDPAGLPRISDGELILRAYDRWAERCVEHLLGDFVFALWDDRRQQMLVARDPLGVHLVAYTADHRHFLVASELGALLTHPAVAARVDDNRVASFLANTGAQPEDSFLQGLRYLAPAHALTVSADDLTVWRYWDIDPARTIRYRSDAEYAGHYLDLLNTAVADRLHTPGAIGVSMSGGLDSTAVAALAAQQLAAAAPARRLHTYSYAFDELASCDEREYIRPVVERFDLDANYLICDDKWALKDLDQWPLSRDYVLADPFALLPATVMKAAGESGTRLLLTGYFGDVLFTGGHYWALDLLRAGRLGRLTRTTLANRRTIRWGESFGEYGLRRLIPTGASRAYRRLRPRSPARTLPGISPALLDRTDLAERYALDQPPSSDWPPGAWQRYKSIFHTVNSQGPGVVRYQYNQNGLEIAIPYYDRRLVEFVMAVPAYILGGPDADRLLHREAMRGILPETVRLRRTPTSFAPLMLVGLQDKEWATIQSLLRKPLIVERGYIDRSWLAERLQHGFDLSPESGLLWRSLSLELWLRRYWS